MSSAQKNEATDKYTGTVPIFFQHKVSADLHPAQSPRQSRFVHGITGVEAVDDFGGSGCPDRSDEPSAPRHFGDDQGEDGYLRVSTLVLKRQDEATAIVVQVKSLHYVDYLSRGLSYR